MEVMDEKRKKGSLSFTVKIINPNICKSLNDDSFPEPEIPFPQKQMVTTRDSDEEEDANDGRRSRKFKSSRSLSIHMRRHPDQLELQKPSPFPTLSPEIPITDLTQSLKGWKKKDRRGRKRNLQGSFLCYTWGLTLREQEEDAINDLKSMRMKSLEEKKKMNRAKKTKTFQDLTLSLSDYKITPTDIDECGFKCITCDKSFKTHQALGGHRSSHNKKTLKQDLKFQGGEKTEGHGEEEEESNYEQHDCKICKKGFSTGQALGGHMRYHYAAGSYKRDHPLDKRAMEDFDLNKLPSEEISLDLDL